MRTIKEEKIIEFEEKKSKFIGYIKPVSTVKEAEEFIEKIKNMHPNATHNVPMYRVIENGQEYFKYNDDGEPSSTAGKPMGEILKILNVYNVSMVATRYFGGIKLGAGGLIRNYAKTAKIAVNEAGIIEMRNRKKFMLDYDYSKTTEIESFLANNEIEILDKNYSDRVTMKIELDEELVEKLEEINGILIIEI